MQFQQVLQFKAKEDLRNEFFCIVCHDICNCPTLKSEDQDEESFCDDYIHHSFNKLSSYFQQNIRFRCDLCGKLIQYLHSKNHQQQCHFLIQNGPQIIHDQFEQNKQLGEILLCKLCNQISFQPQYQDQGIICLFCSQMQPDQTYIEISNEIKEEYQKFKLQCKQCCQNIFIDQLLIHFKQCYKNLLHTMEGYNIVEEKKKLRQKAKKYLKDVDLSQDEMIKMEYDIAFLNELSSKSPKKEVIKLEARLKMLSDD